MSGADPHYPRPAGPTDCRRAVDSECRCWREAYAGEQYYYGDEPGPVARRAVRYHRSFLPRGGTALDAGCGEGQDLAFLAERGYAATGVEFTPEGAAKTRRLLGHRGMSAEVLQQDLRDLDTSPQFDSRQFDSRQFDLVLAVNSVQFMGADASACLDRLIEAVAPGGVIGLSLFGREAHEPTLSDTLWFVTFDELLGRVRGWQCLEAARLWQWNPATGDPQAFVTLIARKMPATGRAIFRMRARRDTP